LVGTDPTGTLDKGNGDDGVSVFASDISQTVVGGQYPGGPQRPGRVAPGSILALFPYQVLNVGFLEVRPNGGWGHDSFWCAVGTRRHCRSSPGGTGRPSRAERLAASATALSSRVARMFSGSDFPCVESSTHRPKDDLPSAGTRTALHTACPTRTTYRSTSVETRSCRSKKRGRASSTTTKPAPRERATPASEKTSGGRGSSWAVRSHGGSGFLPRRYLYIVVKHGLLRSRG
jgi:hypothetical protein